MTLYDINHTLLSLRCAIPVLPEALGGCSPQLKQYFAKLEEAKDQLDSDYFDETDYQRVRLSLTQAATAAADVDFPASEKEIAGILARAEARKDAAEIVQNALFVKMKPILERSLAHVLEHTQNDWGRRAFDVGHPGPILRQEPKK